MIRLLQNITQVLIVSCICARDVRVASKSVVNNSINGQDLLDFGTKVDKPLLRLMGTVITNLEDTVDNLKSKYATLLQEICSLGGCTEWNEWSRCEANNYGGQFGLQKRNRTCGVSTSSCNAESPSEVQIESKICDRWCPKTYEGYSITDLGFCVKIYLKRHKNRTKAEETCRRDGGHLINIDSLGKVRDIKRILHDNSINSSGLWIDGIRSEGKAEWRYNIQPTDPSFTYWDEKQGEPDLRSGKLCKVFYFGRISNEWRWHDAYCDKNIDLPARLSDKFYLHYCLTQVSWTSHHDNYKESNWLTLILTLKRKESLDTVFVHLHNIKIIISLNSFILHLTKDLLHSKKVSNLLSNGISKV